ncbi:DUF2911 domain-containing protein [Lutibacter citreus]|uniref:DUF2911 domain-containing protein n=1 Tax=Lutibacter citreus TaxID=2138210 RepID=UPI000DBE3A97|nr:DUF2911 domain-containing protein [Lutibacter citreus]
MLKKLFIALLFVGVSSTIDAQIKTPQPSPLSKVEQVVGLTDVTLEYSRPAARGRVIFGDLVPFGKTWRTGANANTKITFSDNVKIDGKELKKGTYAIYTIPNKDSWEVIFYEDTNNWGTPQKWDDNKVAVKTTANTLNIPFSVESFTIDINGISNNGATLEFIWENTVATVPFEVPTDKLALKSIENAMSGPTQDDYFQAATYYHTSGKDLKTALKWMEKATAKDAKFWHLRRMSLIQADLGDKTGAIATAKKSLEAATKANNADYVKMNKESIAAWQK